MSVRSDEIGYWSELKLEIVRKYATAYSKILAAQKRFEHWYVDAFAGGGVHVSRTSRQMVPGSPLNALLIDPPFTEYHLVDLDPRKIESLRAVIGKRSDVHIHSGNCNEVLLRQVFPHLNYSDFRRALVLLDPYGLDLRWEVLQTAGQLRTTEVFLNFPTMDMNRNVLWTRLGNVKSGEIARMNAFWGDGSWQDVAYVRHPNLFGDEEPVKVAGMDSVVKAFRERLKKVAGFKHVAEPLPMRNSMRSVLYYLFFASPNDTGDRIVSEIFDSYRNRGI